MPSPLSGKKNPVPVPKGLGLLGALPLRILRIMRSFISKPAKLPGAAVTVVPGVADGGGVGEELRKSGWICFSPIIPPGEPVFEADRARA